MNPEEHNHLPFPTGWFALALCKEVTSGKQRTRQLFGREMQMWRDSSGAVQVSCAAEDRPLLLGIRETNGMILAYFSKENGLIPWHIPEYDLRDCTPLLSKRWVVSSHPQEIHENAADLAHLSLLHDFHIDNYLFQPEKERCFSSYQSTVKIAPWALVLDIHGYMCGLGYAMTHVHIKKFGLHFTMFTTTTPMDHERLELTISIALQTTLFKTAPRRFALFLCTQLARLILFSSASEVEKDVRIWEHKTYNAKPVLVPGDGPIRQYRRWATHFY